MKANFFLRLGAYIIDSLILISVLTAINMFVPQTEKQKEITNQAEAISEKLANEEITVDEYMEQAKSITYYQAKETAVISIISILLTLFYYAIFQFYYGGQTLGKKVVKIKIESTRGNLTIPKLLLRTLIIYTVIPSLVALITVYLMTDIPMYYNLNVAITYIWYALIFISAIMVLYRKDKLGLHDIITKTQVMKVSE
ncbi:MAG: RDD family protein [bacterium]|nr:RDD family protein [bacterium]